MKISVVIPHLFVVLTFGACAQSPKNQAEPAKTVGFTVEQVIGDLPAPWGMAFLPDGAILVSQRSGEFYYCKNGSKIAIKNVPEVYYRGQGGLLDLELHPNYAQNGWLYISYSAPSKDGAGGNTAIMRAKLKNNSLTDQQILYQATPYTTKGQHFGSRLEFDDQGYLYFSIGERGERDTNPQDITRDGGKIYRIFDDGRIPADNPFVDQKGAKTAIYSYGHRNPQGLVWNPWTKELWEHEHGPRGGDEINIIKKGKNYGWPKVTYGINYSGTPITDKTSMPGMEQPIHYWVPSIAPSGAAFVTSDRYPDLKGDLLVGSLAFQYLEDLKLSGKKVTGRFKLLEGMGRIRNVRQAPDGLIYVAIEGKGIYRLRPKD